MPGTFSPSPQVSDPDMHHGTCVTHVPWCMPGSLYSNFFWNWRRGKTFPAFPAHAQPVFLRIWQEAHAIHRIKSQIPECTCTISHNVPFRTEMCTFLFWMEHCRIWNRCILGFVKLIHYVGSSAYCGYAVVWLYTIDYTVINDNKINHVWSLDHSLLWYTINHYHCDVSSDIRIYARVYIYISYMYVIICFSVILQIKTPMFFSLWLNERKYVSL